MRVEDIVAILDLAPHPEGGWYRETFRDIDGPDGRSRSTAIYYLLPQGQKSHWHRVDAVECWHHYDGAPLKLSLAQEGSPAFDIILGADISAGQRPQLIVPVGWWQSAEPMGEWTLCGCTVVPGFEFEGFEMAAEGFEPSS